mmetsp:Transcript_46413/g.74711  ORF Transcript_46413/g.74711 Transcript_46413/m.74711 type:complete len:345 (-) Transcript_46413:207-1241(-)
MLHAGKLPNGGEKEMGARDRPEDGDLVILVTGHSNLQCTYLEAGKTTQNKHGSFSHDEMLAAPYGTKIWGRDRKGFIMMLRPTPELWTDSLPHRTQIIYNTDISNIIFRLELIPGCIAIESGTGSGSLTHSMARAVGPKGHVYSFDYHELRVEQAAVEFKKHGMAHVTVAHADVCEKGFSIPEGVFADGILLDLPNPWLAVSHAKNVLRDMGRLASYSPCIEQVQKTCEALRKEGFTDVTTIEVLVRHWDMHKLQLDVPRFDLYDPGVSRSVGSHALTKKRRRGEEESATAEPFEEEPDTASRIYQHCLKAREVERGHTSYLTFAVRPIRANTDKGSLNKVSLY